jgi:hypothetical protein
MPIFNLFYLQAYQIRGKLLLLVPIHIPTNSTSMPLNLPDATVGGLRQSTNGQRATVKMVN